VNITDLAGVSEKCTVWSCGALPFKKVKGRTVVFSACMLRPEVRVIPVICLSINPRKNVKWFIV